MNIIPVQFRCTYTGNRWWSRYKEALLCDTRFLKVTTPWEKFTKVERNYSSTNSEVQSIGFFRQTMNYIPSGLEKIFPDLIEIYIQECNLLRVEQSNFKPFPELKALAIRGNRYLLTLERGLFDYNKQLIHINLFYNNFKHIDANLLDGMSSLNFFALQFNTCVNVTISNALKRGIVKTKLKLNCINPVVLQQHGEISARLNFHRKLRKEIQNCDKQLHDENNQMKQKNERNKIIISRFNKLHDDINSLSKQFYAPTDGSSLITSSAQLLKDKLQLDKSAR